MSTEERQFAYGSNAVDGRPCPSNAAGYNPGSNGVACEIAEKYDDYARTLAENDEGTLPDHLAQQAWEQMIDFFEDVRSESSDDSSRRYYEERIELATEIQAELWW